jgi:hypothetical protein
MTSKRGNGGGAVDRADINGVLAHFELIFELLAQPHSRNLLFFGHSEPAPTSAPSTECLIILYHNIIGPRFSECCFKGLKQDTSRV